jgi:lysozyme
MTLHMTDLEREVADDEGFRAHLYKCTAGAWSIGHGTNLSDGIDREEALLLMRHRLGKVITALESRLPFWFKLTDDRRRVLANMGYQLGIAGLMGFKRMLAALERGDYEAAAREMLDSKWAKRDTPGRAGRLAERMRRG